MTADPLEDQPDSATYTRPSLIDEDLRPFGGPHQSVHCNSLRGGIVPGPLQQEGPPQHAEGGPVTPPQGGTRARSHHGVTMAAPPGIRQQGGADVIAAVHAATAAAAARASQTSKA